MVQCSGGRPSLLASGSAGAMPSRPSPFAVLLQPLTERMNALELMFSDLHPETVTRTLDRMHYLEQHAREHCNNVVRIIDARKVAVMEASDLAEKRCTDAVQQAEKACKRLVDAGDRHQREAAGVRQELGSLKQTIGDKFDQMMSDVDHKISTMEQMLSDVAEEKRAVFEESLVARSQQLLEKRVEELFLKGADELPFAGIEDSGNRVRRGRAFLQAQREVRSRSASVTSVEAHTSECHRVAGMRSPRDTGHDDANHTWPVASPPNLGSPPFRAHHYQSAGSSWGIVPHQWAETNEEIVRPVVLLGNVAGIGDQGHPAHHDVHPVLAIPCHMGEDQGVHSGGTR